MGVLMFLIVGAFAGWLAGVLEEGAGRGLAVDILVGMVGAVLGGLLLGALGPGGAALSLGDISGSGFLEAVTGAVALLAVVRLVTRRRGARTT